MGRLYREEGIWMEGEKDIYWRDEYGGREGYILQGGIWRVGRIYTRGRNMEGGKDIY